jgi:hypothetical protein
MYQHIENKNEIKKNKFFNKKNISQWVHSLWVGGVRGNKSNFNFGPGKDLYFHHAAPTVTQGLFLWVHPRGHPIQSSLMTLKEAWGTYSNSILTRQGMVHMFK